MTEGLEKLKKSKLSILGEINNKENLLFSNVFSELSNIDKIKSIDFSGLSAISKLGLSQAANLSNIGKIDSLDLSNTSILLKQPTPKKANVLIQDNLKPKEESKKQIKLPDTLPKKEE